MKLTRLAKTVFFAGAIALGGVGGYKAHQAYQRFSAPQEPAHDNNTFILHLEDERSLGDVELLWDPTDEYTFDGWSRIEGFPGSYLINPTKESDANIADIIRDVEKDDDVLDAEYNLQMSLPEDELEKKSKLRQVWENIWGKANGYIPLQKGIDGLGSMVGRVANYFSDNSAPRESINDPIYKEGKLWGQMVTGMDKIDELLQEYGLTVDDLSEVKVYILDTGCDESHEDLLVTADKKDGHGHGTHVAGTIGALTNNETGVSSIDVEGVFDMYCTKVLSDWGMGDMYTITQAIKKAADEGAIVINMSLGGKGSSTLMDKAVKYADDKGTVVVVAAGNSNEDAKNFSPANVPEAVTVAAVGHEDEKLKRAFYSNFGDTVDICAPGGDLEDGIISTIPLKSNIGKQRPDKIYQPGYAELMGTSMATPHTVSVIALMKAVNPELDRDGIVRILQETGMEAETEKGKPIGKCIDAYAAVKRSLDLAMEWGVYEE